MKKSQIYKYALISTIKDLAAEHRCSGADPEKAFAIVNELCERIRAELAIESVRERNLSANATAAGDAEGTE